MTDNEIKKALQNAINEGDAPIGERFGCVISKSTAKEILDLINRQQAEIERLNQEKIIACSFIPVRGCGKVETKMKMLSNTIEAIENIAIKEFWNRLQGIAYRSEVEWSHGEHPMLIELDDAEEIYEEMVGDAE